MSVLSWLRDLGARWSAPRPDPPELVAVEREIEAAIDPRAARVVARALSAAGTCTYALGRGGRHPEAASPGDADGRLDCSGFASWCLGLDRKSDAIDGGWISTDSIVRDATGKRRLFRSVDEIHAGDLVVFPGRYVAGRRVAIGHVGVVVEAGPTIEACRVAHCHGPSGRSPAISVRDGRTWRRGIAVRPVAWG